MTTLHEESQRDIFSLDNVRRSPLKVSFEIVEFRCELCGTKVTGTMPEFEAMGWDWVTGYFPKRKSCCASCLVEHKGQWETILATAMSEEAALML